MADCILVGGGGGGTLSEDVTAAKANVLVGKRTVTTDSNDEVVEGTMSNNGAISHSLALNGTYTVPAGYHNGSGRVTQSLTVISPTTTNLALNGTYTIPQGWHNGTGKVTQNLTVIAAANHTLAINGTYTIPQGWHNGQGKVVQSVTTQGATNYYATTSAQTISSGRYLTGNLTIGALSNSNLSAGNIKKGVTINIHNGTRNVWSVTGTWEGYVASTDDLYNRGQYGQYGTLTFDSNTTAVIQDTAQITFRSTSEAWYTNAINFAMITPVAINMARYTRLTIEGTTALGSSGAATYTSTVDLYVDLLNSIPSGSDRYNVNTSAKHLTLGTKSQTGHEFTWTNPVITWSAQNTTKYLRILWRQSSSGARSIAGGSWVRLTLS